MKKLLNWLNGKLKEEMKFQADVAEAELNMRAEIEKSKLEYERQKQLKKDILACNLYLYYEEDNLKDIEEYIAIKRRQILHIGL